MAKSEEFTPEAVARYLTERIARKRKGKPKGRRGWLRAALAEKEGSPAPGETKADALEIGARVTDLEALLLEKADLFRQIVSDRRLLGERGKWASQENILGALEAAAGGEENWRDLRSLAGSIESHMAIRSSAEEARLRLAEVDGKVMNLVADHRVLSSYRVRLAGRIRTIRAARKVEALRKIGEQTGLARMELLALRNSENRSLTTTDNDVIGRCNLINRYAEEKSRLLTGDDEVYYETKRRELLEYRRQLLSDGFVKTETIMGEVLGIISHLKLGIPVLLRGHLGAGKTEVALHVGRRYFGHEPEFISGSEEATKYDIYGKTQIGLRPEADKLRDFKIRMDEYQQMNPDASKKELKEMEKQFYQTIVVKGQTTSFFQYGPLIRAIKEGKPLIIDEMDGIPHSIIMRLNHVLTRRPGDTVRVQEDGGEEIKVMPGFCVMATGNIKSARYKREELDAAFLSRWWSSDITYPPQKETYEILVASLLDERGNLYVKDYSDLDDLRRLTLAASEIQKIFTEEHLDYFGEGADSVRDKPASLKKTVLSLRHLWNIVRPWKARNFDRKLEEYILEEFIRPAVAEDQVYLVQLFCRFRYFRNWKADQFSIQGLTDSKLLAFQGHQAQS